MNDFPESVLMMTSAKIAGCGRGRMKTGQVVQVVASDWAAKSVLRVAGPSDMTQINM